MRKLHGNSLRILLSKLFNDFAVLIIFNRLSLYASAEDLYRNDKIFIQPQYFHEEDAKFRPIFFVVHPHVKQK